MVQHKRRSRRPQGMKRTIREIVRAQMQPVCKEITSWRDSQHETVCNYIWRTNKRMDRIERFVTLWVVAWMIALAAGAVVVFMFGG